MPLVGFHPQTRQPQVTQVTFPTVIWQVVFKDVRDDIVFLSNEPWHTRIKPLCSPHGTHYAASGHASPSPPAPPLSSHYRVSVLRDMPPVLLVHDFATEEECEWLVNETLPRMKPSLIVRGGVFSTNSKRQSSSALLLPSYDDHAHPLTRVASRQFAFAREVGGYPHLTEGAGQEPIWATQYKEYGDQYLPHCDGDCKGGAWASGRRIATSLLYCNVAEQGGATSFTRAGIKVLPQRRQLLFFGYKLESGRMDNGLTEHTGCPVRAGSKWIATQWYREGISAYQDFSHYQSNGLD